jgi:putative sporulation protein YtaF
MILFALALNLDSFCCGVAYGSRRIKVPLSSLLIISLISMAAISISMLGGRFIGSFISPEVAKKLGGIIFLCIGARVIYLARQAKYLPEKDEVSETVIKQPKKVEIRIPPLGLVVQILKEPAIADLDRSGTISSREAFFLGIALAMDAFGAGFAISLMGFPIFTTALVVGIGHYCLICLGILIGRFIMVTRFGCQLTALPGCILILLGVLKLF